MDAIIIGGGSAGCATAILLKRYNPSARMVLFEKDKFSRHHVGESTLPDANAVLHKLGVIDALNRAGFPIKCGLTYKSRHNILLGMKISSVPPLMAKYSSLPCRGDGCGSFVDPILSSGLNLAHNCALLVANAINTEWNHPDVPAPSFVDTAEPALLQAASCSASSTLSGPGRTW
ncbi:MAG: tryptophan 7-halogenase [Candidatus Binatia bacterium]